MNRTKKLFKFLNDEAFSCPKCREKLSCVSVKMGFDDEIIGAYACENENCQAHRSGFRAYRRLLPGAVRRIFEEGYISEEERLFIERQRSAAMAAEIRCPKCGYKRRYVESVFSPEGKLFHKFRCDNKDCSDFGKSIKTELSEWGCDRILGEVKQKSACVICGKLSGAKVLCEKSGGFICEEHCRNCEFLENRTSMVHCVWFARVGAAEAAKKGFEAFEKALRIHREI